LEEGQRREEQVRDVIIAVCSPFFSYVRGCELVVAVVVCLTVVIYCAEVECYGVTLPVLTLQVELLRDRKTLDLESTILKTRRAKQDEFSKKYVVLCAVVFVVATLH
jgi:hypothetical protein